MKKSKKRKRQQQQEEEANLPNQNQTKKKKGLPLQFDFRYIVAPMVGASELPFRLLCRKYGAQLAYTPMMSAAQFATSQDYRKKEFQTAPFDRPLVCHFAANTPEDLAKAAQIAEPHCDAIDLNLGCPQRTAYVGHFGSYLLDAKDRSLVVSMVQAAAQAVNIPIFCKIRLLSTYEETLHLCQQLYNAGASLIAVHARYRASFHRKGPGARDGPALLDQVQKLRQDLSNDDKYRGKLLVTNGNTITYQDVVKNLELTAADGIMSAEGILDNPALYLERLGRQEGYGDNGSEATIGFNGSSNSKIIKVKVKGGKVFDEWPKRKKYTRKLKKIADLEAVVAKEGEKDAAQSSRDRKKLQKKKEKLETKLRKLCTDGSTYVPLHELVKAADDKLQLAQEYITLVRQYPATMRTVIFHTRRMLKGDLTKYQLLEECLACTSLDDVQTILAKIQKYRNDPDLFQFDVDRAKREREALERKKIEEGKRKAYEARMIRKAKREKRTDLEYYLRQGATVPTLATVEELRSLSKEQQLQLWKDRGHSQHCVAFHLSKDGCPRGRGCAFLHVESQTKNSFEERDEVAG